MASDFDMELNPIKRDLDKDNILLYYTLEKEGIGLAIRNLDQWPTQLKMLVAAALQETASKLALHETDPKTDKPAYN